MLGGTSRRKHRFDPVGGFQPCMDWPSPPLDDASALLAFLPRRKPRAGPPEPRSIQGV